MEYNYLDTPVGELLLAGEGGVLRILGFPDGPRCQRAGSVWTLRTDGLKEARAQLTDYFSGSLKSFDLKLAPDGTPFQLAVLAELRKIPYGTTVSYADIARRIGRPAAVRAVGAANGRNPIPVVIPCHRVIGSNGQLTGFGGGLPRKQKLLRLELENSGLLSGCSKTM